jgi:glycine/D-amino acid oxidase-like deaminating enzyme
MRYYHGFRPFAPDHLPVIGSDPTTAGLWHAHGHEGAGIGLAPATGDLIAALITGTPTTLDAAAFSPGRFSAGVPR